MRINNNIMAMNAHRQLAVNQSNASKSMEKLSSGLRITRAGDDAAGLAISEKMRGQIRGLKMAARNAQDGISLIQTAEGALSETHAILQRMRELAVQAANDTNVDVDRSEIQKEINALTSEINRIGNTTEFNTQRVLKGADDPIELKPALALDGLGLSGPVTETSGGKTHAAEGARVTLNILTSVTGGAVANKAITFNLQGHEITLVFRTSDENELPGPQVEPDGTQVTVTVANNGSATNVADAIKAGLEEAIAANANIGADAYTIGGDGTEVSISSSATGLDQFINVNVTDADGILDSGSILFATGKDVTYTASQAEVDFSSVTIAELAGKGITINNQSIEFYNADEGVYQGEADFAVNISAVSSGGDLVAAIANQLGDKLDGVKLSFDPESDPVLLVVTATANGEAGNGIVIADGVDRPAVTADGKFVARLQVGSNEGQSMTIEIADMRARALGITGSGEGFTSELVVTDGTSNEMQEAALDVSTHESASKAVTIIDKAIEAVSTQRSQLGAFQNRLEHTISNLGTSAENLQAAESRIRDLDMAEEIMAFTKNNILQQAATAMLAQANMAPQSVLQLLG